MKRLSIVVVFLAWFAAPAGADYATGSGADVHKLAVIYGYGARDYKETLRRFRRAAEQGNVTAQFQLGLLYDKGTGVPQDHEEAARWYRMAAENEDAAAQFNLGLLYFKGTGVAQDDQEAAHWFRQAAEQNDASAQYNLAFMCYNGQGVLQDYVQAHMWLDLSARHGEPKPSAVRDVLSLLMSQSQIAEAQRLAREWKPKK